MSTVGHLSLLPPGQSVQDMQRSYLHMPSVTLWSPANLHMPSVALWSPAHYVCLCSQALTDALQMLLASSFHEI